MSPELATYSRRTAWQGKLTVSQIIPGRFTVRGHIRVRGELPPDPVFREFSTWEDAEEFAVSLIETADHLEEQVNLHRATELHELKLAEDEIYRERDEMREASERVVGSIIGG